jgi:hypothetical protein
MKRIKYFFIDLKLKKLHKSDKINYDNICYYIIYFDKKKITFYGWEKHYTDSKDKGCYFYDPIHNLDYTFIDKKPSLVIYHNQY